MAAAKIISSAGLRQFTAARTSESLRTPLVGYRGAILVGSTLFVAFSGCW